MNRRFYDAQEDVSETGNWNVAKPYTEIKVMRHLYLLDLYDEIATFGTAEFLEEFTASEKMKTYARIRAINRFYKHLKMLWGNTYFAVVNKKDKETMQNIKVQINLVGGYLPMVQTKTFNAKDKTYQMRINEEEFTLVLDSLIQLKENILEPLNKADLIFTSVDDYDPAKMKEKLMQEMIDTP